MKRILWPIFALIPLASSLQSRTCYVDGVFTPPDDDHRVFRVTIAFFDLRNSDKPLDTQFEDVNGSTPFTLAFSSPPGVERIKVAFTPALQGFDPVIKTFILSDIPNNKMHASFMTWIPAKTSQAKVYSDNRKKTTASVEAEQRGKQVSPVSKRYRADDVNRVIALAPTGNEKIDAAQLKIKALLVRHDPRGAFQVYNDTVKDNIFYQADKSKKLAFLS